ncbi:hypothetical protein ACIQ1D_18800 [Lysinibacillus xylanilyticus]|uniref:hypothetical protein n=1 Tax=Lysinibacillus xylanilyticus TaxID=582475 RepID=UPI00382DE18A
MIFGTKINTSVLDRILISDKQTVAIQKKVDKFMKDEILLNDVMEAEMPLNPKGILVMRAIDLEKKLKLKNEIVNHFYFNIEKGIEIAEIDTDGNMKYKVVFESLRGAYKVFVFDKKTRILESEIVEVAKHIGNVVLDFFRYTKFVNYLNQENMVVVRRAKANKKESKNKHNDKNKNDNSARNVVSVSKPKKVYDYIETTNEEEKRSYERKAESWGVAGHWREYKKSGKRVFVKAHKKGEGTTKGKDYTV